MIADCCDASLLDADNIARAMQVQEHALTPVLDDLGRVIREHVAAKQAEEQRTNPGVKPVMTPDEVAGYLHWGATTQNITQTGFVLNLRRAHSLILSSVSKFVAVIGRLCKDKADLVMPGRTHGQQALPITFGYKCAAWLDELLRHAERLAQSADRLFRAILGGGAGTYASFGERGPQVASIYARRLGLKAMVVPFRNSVDHFSEYVMVLALLGTTCGKMAREIRELGKDEFGEVSEPVHDGGVGSSTMPQKVNPKLCMGIIVLETKLRSLPAVALEAMLGDHEADGARTAMVGEACVDAVRNTSRILDLCTALFGGMRFFPMRMMQNFQHSDGMITSERLMLELGRRGMGRDHAHHLVHQLCVNHGRRLRAFREQLRLHLMAPPGSANRKAKSFNDLQGLQGSPSPSKGGSPRSSEADSPADGQSPTHDATQAGSLRPEGTPPPVSFGPPSASSGVSVRTSAEGLPISRMAGTPGRFTAKPKRSRPRRMSIDSIAQGGGGNFDDENGPTHPGSLAALASADPDIVKYLGNGDAAAAQVAAENLLNPKNYTGECSKIATSGAKRARRATSALSDLALRYHSISELVFHGRSEAGNADKISVLIEQVTDRADAFEAISEADELKEVPSFAPAGQISLPAHERVSSLNLVAAEASIEARQRRLVEGSPTSPRPDPGGTTPGPPA